MKDLENILKEAMRFVGIVAVIMVMLIFTITMAIVATGIGAFLGESILKSM